MSIDRKLTVIVYKICSRAPFVNDVGSVLFIFIISDPRGRKAAELDET